MKILGISLAILGLSSFLAEPTYARNVKLILPIAAAMEATDIPDKPTGTVKFFFATQATPKIVANLGATEQPQKRAPRVLARQAPTRWLIS
jgi:hypothetical protein